MAAVEPTTTVPTAEEVSKLFGPHTVAADVVTDIHIPTACAFVDEQLGDKTFPNSLKKAITLYLSAHFLALSEERGALTRSYFGDAEEWLEGRFYTSGFGSTRFGQQAIALDPSGTLATVSHSTKGSAQFEVV